MLHHLYPQPDLLEAFEFVASALGKERKAGPVILLISFDPAASCIGEGMEPATSALDSLWTID